MPNSTSPDEQAWDDDLLYRVAVDPFVDVARSGTREGRVAGLKRGYLDGLNIGTSKGWELGLELGYYNEFAREISDHVLKLERRRRTQRQYDASSMISGEGGQRQRQQKQPIRTAHRTERCRTLADDISRMIDDFPDPDALLRSGRGGGTARHRTTAKEEEGEGKGEGGSTTNDSTHDDDKHNDDDDGMLNISLECHADTNTSYLDDDVEINTRSAFAEQRENAMSSSEEEREDGRRGTTSIVVRVADFSDSCGTVVDADGGIPSTTNVVRDTRCVEESRDDRSRGGQESPFRAAFRRGAREVSNRLPPMMSSPSNILYAAAASAPTTSTPGRRRFHRSTGAASAAFDKAATTTVGLLPQFARQCFSFEDTTIDDDSFLASPYDGGEGGGQHHATTHEYYGLSGVASFVVGERDETAEGDDNRGGASGVASPRVSHASSTGRRKLPIPRRPGSSGGVEDLDSPFRVIRESRTWAGNSLLPREASSLDAWTTSRGGRWSHRHLGNEIHGTVGTFSMEGAKRDDATEKDWKVSVMSKKTCHAFVSL